jgi:hypothetical protein
MFFFLIPVFFYFIKYRFSTPGSNFGLFCSTPGVPLARSVPRKISAYMLMTGLPLTAEDALNFGLISKLAKDAEHLEQVKNYKKTFTDHSDFEYFSCDRPGTIFLKSLNIFDFIRDPNYKLLWIFFRSWIALLMPSNQNQEVLLLW